MTRRAANPRVYLDHNATAPVRDGVVAAVERALRMGGNPSSVHAEGRAAKRAVEDARAQVAALVGATAEDVVFTASGTEANTLALRGVGRSRALASAVEHKAVLAARDDIELIDVTADGVVDLNHLADLLARSAVPAVVSVMLANNETGVIQPVAEVAHLAHERGALVHCDAVQAAGKIPVSMAGLGVDMLSLSAHKIGGPQGVGALVLRPGVEVAAQVPGGGQEKGRRGGTENVGGIVGFGVAATEAFAELDAFAETALLRDRCEQGLRAACSAAVVHGRAALRLPNTSFVSMPGVKGETQVMAFDLDGFAVSAGSACSSGKVGASRVLGAMGLGDVADAVRVSIGTETKESHIDAFIAAWATLYTRKARDEKASAA